MKPSTLTMKITSAIVMMFALIVMMFGPIIAWEAEPWVSVFWWMAFFSATRTFWICSRVFP